MSVEEVSATGVLDVIQQRANTQRDHTRGTSRTGHRRFVVTIHGNGQHPTHLHQGRTHSELGAPSSSSLRNVTIPCCIGSQPVRQVRAIISSVNEQSS